MQPKKDLAIVLRAIRYQDRHQIVHALTQYHGKVEAIAYNSISSRRFAGGLEPFTVSEWIFQENLNTELIHLSSVSPKKKYLAISRNFSFLSLASAINELLLAITVSCESSADLFKLHCNTLSVLEDIACDMDSESEGAYDDIKTLVLGAYFSKILQWSGNLPQLERCLGCFQSYNTYNTARDDAYFYCNIPSAGWICQKCKDLSFSSNSNSSSKQNLHACGPFEWEQFLLKITPRSIDYYGLFINFSMRQIKEKFQAGQLGELHIQAEKSELQRNLHNIYLFLEALVVYHLPGLETKPFRSFRFLKIDHSIFSKLASN